MKKTNVKGITLIALVVTIVVLLILAGVSIAMLTGENGIITQSQNAKVETEKEEIAFSLDAIQDPVSLQEPIYNDGSESIYIMDQVKDSKNSDENWAENMTIAEALKRLSEKEKRIIIKRYFDGRTQMEVAEEIGISQAQVSRLEKNALDNIKRYYK